MMNFADQHRGTGGGAPRSRSMHTNAACRVRELCMSRLRAVFAVRFLMLFLCCFCSGLWLFLYWFMAVFVLKVSDLQGSTHCARALHSSITWSAYLLRGICTHNKSHNLHLILGLKYAYVFLGVGMRTSSSTLSSLSSASSRSLGWDSRVTSKWRSTNWTFSSSWRHRLTCSGRRRGHLGTNRGAAAVTRPTHAIQSAPASRNSVGDRPRPKYLYCFWF